MGVGAPSYGLTLAQLFNISKGMGNAIGAAPGASQVGIGVPLSPGGVLFGGPQAPVSPERPDVKIVHNPLTNTDAVIFLDPCICSQDSRIYVEHLPDAKKISFRARTGTGFFGAGVGVVPVDFCVTTETLHTDRYWLVTGYDCGPDLDCPTPDDKWEFLYDLKWTDPSMSPSPDSTPDLWNPNAGDPFMMPGCRHQNFAVNAWGTGLRDDAAADLLKQVTEMAGGYDPARGDEIVVTPNSETSMKLITPQSFRRVTRIAEPAPSLGSPPPGAIGPNK